MQFKDVIGQESTKQKLIQAVVEDRIPHAQLLVGPPGNGKLALAVAFAQYINCSHKEVDDSCGECYGNGNDKCISCSFRFKQIYLLNNLNCVDKCPGGYYYLDSVNNCKGKL